MYSATNLYTPLLYFADSHFMKHNVFIIWLMLTPIHGLLAQKGGINFFEKEIRPILIEHCYECHSSGKKVRGGLLLDSRAGIEAGGDSGRVITPGDPEASRLVNAIRYKNRDLQMPPKNKLSAGAILKLEEWIRMGAPDPRDKPSTKISTQRGMSVEEGRTFWSFQPVARPTIPKLESSFIRSPIDAFVLNLLSGSNLSPAPEADKRTLIRRATQNLTGLPPTHEEVKAFLNDDCPNAYQKLIERLLASPQYGVHWGRHWLDVARYADSNGLDENLGFGNAWRYRDYVVNAFNSDKPYDKFLIEQIAGDLIEHASQESMTATCFLQLGPKVLAEPDIKKLEMDVIDEQLDTLGKTFLGMTFGCARCHDHKFDPILQTDYYSLAAIFKSTTTLEEVKPGARKQWYEHPIGTDEENERIGLIDEKIKELKSAASTYKSKEIVRLRGVARSNATEYLVACLDFEPGASLRHVESIAKPRGLHTRILHHCRMHLNYNRDQPFFADWHRFAKAGDKEGLRSHYSTLLKETQDAFKAARKKDPKTKKLEDARLESARAALYNNAGFLAVPNVDTFAFDAKTLTEYRRLQEVAREFETSAPDKAGLMGVSEGEIVDTLPVLIRGNHNSPGKEVRRGFPLVMRSSEKPTLFSIKTSGRLELARWMASPEHPLTARVMVNRIWAWHFGRGLVTDTENFGVRSERPSNPELLDWLAAEFVKSGWSIKAMHRLILNSSTWRMDSRHPDQAMHFRADPENRLHWKQNLRRLQAEQIRDSILAVSGQLDQTLGGKTLPLRNRQMVFNHTSKDRTKYNSLRRAAYLPVIRNNLYPLFEQFDFPDPTIPTGTRNETVIAPQALILLNDPLVMDSAEALAKQVSKLGSRENGIHQAWMACFQRMPQDTELEGSLVFLKNNNDAWALLCQTLLASNEFMYVR